MIVSFLMVLLLNKTKSKIALSVKLQFGGEMNWL